MNPRFDLYVSRQSWVHELDPRTKMAFVGVSFVVLLLAKGLLLPLGYLVLVHLLLLRGAHVPWKRIGWLWRQLWVVSLLVLMLWPLSNPTGTPVLMQWWRIRITLPGMRQGAVAALRVNALAFAMFVLLVTTDQTSLVQGLVRLGLPFEWGLTLAIGLRYLPSLYGTYGSISDAQRARGWTPERAGVVRRLRTYVPTLVALVISALRLTDTLTLALAARGFRPGYPRTTRLRLRLRTMDWVCLAGLSLLLVGTIGWQLARR
jgi:energy-coupling factor transport system permease protein